MPRNGTKRQPPPEKKEDSSDTRVELCLRIPMDLHKRLVTLQARHMRKTGENVSRNALIVDILQKATTDGTSKRA